MLFSHSHKLEPRPVPPPSGASTTLPPGHVAGFYHKRVNVGTARQTANAQLHFLLKSRNE